MFHLSYIHVHSLQHGPHVGHGGFLNIFIHGHQKIQHGSLGQLIFETGKSSNAKSRSSLNRLKFDHTSVPHKYSELHGEK